MTPTGRPRYTVNMQVLKLVRNRVAIGEPLPWNVRDGNRKLLLASGHVITDEAQLETLLERGAFVDAEEVKAAAARAAGYVVHEALAG